MGANNNKRQRMKKCSLKVEVLTSNNSAKYRCIIYFFIFHTVLNKIKRTYEFFHRINSFLNKNWLSTKIRFSSFLAY